MQDDTFTIQWGNWKKKFEAPKFYWALSLSEGFKPGHKQPAEQASKNVTEEVAKDKMLQDDLNIKADLSHPEIGLNIGSNLKFGELKIDIMGYGYFDRLSENERNELINFVSADQRAKIEGYDRFRIGAQARIKYKNANVFAGFLSARDGFLSFKEPGLGRIAYVGEFFYEIDAFKINKFPISIIPLISYSKYEIEGKSKYLEAESWDREQIIISCIFGVKYIKFKTEYIINDEETGEPKTKIKNNEFLVQLEVKW